MDIYEVVASMNDQERRRAEAVEIMHALTDHPYFWRVEFFEGNRLYVVDILHRYDEVKDAKCAYCKEMITDTKSCTHISAAYIAVAKQLAEPFVYNVEEDLARFSKGKLIHMLALLHRQSEKILKPFLQPDVYTKVEAYAIIDAALSRVEGWIDRSNEEVALAGLNQVMANAQWLYQKDPILAIRHQLACSERLVIVAERCDEEVHRALCSVAYAHLDYYLAELKNKSFAQAANEELLQSIHACARLPLQSDFVVGLFSYVIHLSRVSHKRKDIQAVLEQYRGVVLSEEQYVNYLMELKRNVMTRDERLASYAEQDVAFARLRELLIQAETYGDTEEGLALCDRLDRYLNYPNARVMQKHFRNKLQNLYS